MWVETLPFSGVVVPSTVNVPLTDTERSVNLILVVHVPSLVVERPLVVVIGPVGVSLAETITVREFVQVLTSHRVSGIEVAPSVAERVLLIVKDDAGAHPNSSERKSPVFGL
ncbi:MAG: hypothetical protein ABIP77_07815 [Candidatus Limnocylindrales bacterium]